MQPGMGRSLEVAAFCESWLLVLSLKQQLLKKQNCLRILPFLWGGVCFFLSFIAAKEKL